MDKDELKDAFLEHFSNPVPTWNGRAVMVEAKACGLTLIKLWVRDDEILEIKHDFDKEST
jgi:hypothetical protein